jgi:hypothetical protein
MGICPGMQAISKKKQNVPNFDIPKFEIMIHWMEEKAYTGC